VSSSSGVAGGVKLPPVPAAASRRVI
jgi:hypothetical protein